MVLHALCTTLLTLEDKGKNQTQGFPTCLPPALTFKAFIVGGVREMAAAGYLVGHLTVISHLGKLSE